MSTYEKRRQQMERDRAKAQYEHDYKSKVRQNKGQQKGLSGGGLATGKTGIKKKTNPYRLGDY